MPLTFGLQGDEDAPVILGDGRASRPDIADRGGDGGVATGDLEDRLLPFLHAVGRDVLSRFADAEDKARVLLREEAFGDDDEKPHGGGDRREHDAERDEPMSESDDQSAIVDGDEPGEEGFERTRNPALLRMAPAPAAILRRASE